MAFSITELQLALDRCIREGYMVFASHYNRKVYVTLSRSSTGSGLRELKVEGNGDTVKEAFDCCFNNFPANPLDGISRWKDERLAAPVTDVLDDDVTEVKS